MKKLSVIIVLIMLLTFISSCSAAETEIRIEEENKFIKDFEGEEFIFSSAALHYFLPQDETTNQVNEAKIKKFRANELYIFRKRDSGSIQ